MHLYGALARVYEPIRFQTHSRWSTVNWFAFDRPDFPVGHSALNIKFIVNHIWWSIPTRGGGEGGGRGTT